jgi:hypothetical protein
MSWLRGRGRRGILIPIVRSSMSRSMTKFWSDTARRSITCCLTTRKPILSKKRPRRNTNLGWHAQPILPILNASKRPLLFNSSRNHSSCRRELNLLSFVVNVPWISRRFSIRYQPCPSVKDRLSRSSSLMGLMPLPYLAV